ncbi:hypothetical protein MBLNU459_g2725t1 [Dothideomycetes sp. NU459]
MSGPDHSPTATFPAASHSSSVANYPSPSARDRALLVRCPPPNSSLPVPLIEEPRQAIQRSFPPISPSDLGPNKRVTYEIGPTGNHTRRIFHVPAPPNYPKGYTGPRIRLVHSGSPPIPDNVSPTKTTNIRLHFIDSETAEDFWCEDVLSNEPIGAALEEYRKNSGRHYEALRFEFTEGQRVRDVHTPNQLGMSAPLAYVYVYPPLPSSPEPDPNVDKEEVINPGLGTTDQDAAESIDQVEADSADQVAPDTPWFEPRPLVLYKDVDQITSILQSKLNGNNLHMMYVEQLESDNTMFLIRTAPTGVSLATPTATQYLRGVELPSPSTTPTRPPAAAGRASRSKTPAKLSSKASAGRVTKAAAKRVYRPRKTPAPQKKATAATRLRTKPMPKEDARAKSASQAKAKPASRTKTKPSQATAALDPQTKAMSIRGAGATVKPRNLEAERAAEEADIAAAAATVTANSLSSASKRASRSKTTLLRLNKEKTEMGQKEEARAMYVAEMQSLGVPVDDHIDEDDHDGRDDNADYHDREATEQAYAGAAQILDDDNDDDDKDADDDMDWVEVGVEEPVYFITSGNRAD